MTAGVIEIIRGLGLGGAETLLFQRAQFAKRNNLPTPLVINTHSGHDYFHIPLQEAEITVQDLNTSNRLISALRLWRQAGKFPEDAVVIVHSPWPAAVLKLRKASRRMPQRLVEVVHSQSRAYPMIVLAKILNRFADVIVAVSDDVAQSPTTANAPHKEIVLAGVDSVPMRDWISAHPEAPADMRAQLGLAPSTKLIVTVANLFDFKGIDITIRALSEIDSEVHLVVIGEGPFRNELERTANELGLTERVHLIGRRENAWKWLAVGDVVSHPSRREGLPVSLIEARVLDVPIVASDAGGISTVLASDRNSIVIEDVTLHKLSAAIIQTLETAPPVEKVFAQRGCGNSEWHIERYAIEFNKVARGTS